MFYIILDCGFVLFISGISATNLALMVHDRFGKDRYV